jgi:hypothetical protein
VRGRVGGPLVDQGCVLVDVVGTEFTGSGELGDLLDELKQVQMTSENTLRWRELTAAAARAELLEVDEWLPAEQVLAQVTSAAEVAVSLNLPQWFPLATVLQVAGSRALQVVVDEALPKHLHNLGASYTWWAGAEAQSFPRKQRSHGDDATKRKELEGDLAEETFKRAQAEKHTVILRTTLAEEQVSFLGDAYISQGDAESSLGDAESSLVRTCRRDVATSMRRWWGSRRS